ncbi:hypothetical protein IW262DRAFT_1479277 [Armillaria fumosa]|nr:hypothetical protein IW262DRAFT_1479277 [Armillaria fumosa]
MASSSYPDIWEISDDEYDEPPFQSSFISSSQLTFDSNTKNEVIDLSDTDSDNDPPPPSSQIPSSSQPRPSSPVAIDLTLSDDDEGYYGHGLPTLRATVLDDDSDSDLPPPELLSQSPRKRRLTWSIDNDTDASPTKKVKSQSSSPVKAPMASASSGPAKDHNKQKRRRRTSQERRDEEQEKEARKAQKARERELKKAAELAAKERKKQEKIEAAAMLAQQKTEAAAKKDANKLQHNKRDMHTHADLLPSLKEKFRELRGTVLFGRQLLRDHHTIQWKMRSNKRYNAETRNWIPCKEHEVLQSTALLYISGANLVHLVRTKMLVQTVKDFRNACGGQSSHRQTFIMVERLERERQRNDVHQALASLNITCHTHHVFVESVEETVERLYNITADIGIKPYKLIERSHLPFCADFKQIESGKTLKETWNRMLRQIPGVTFSGAQGILEHYPTVSSLFRKYAENLAPGELLLQDCMVRERADGMQNARRLNKAISTRVHAVMCGQDELEVVARGA